MRRFLTGMLAIAALLVLSPSVKTVSAQSNDEAELKRLVSEWAEAAKRGDVSTLDRIQASTFRGSAQGIGFNGRTLRAALQSGQMSVEGWTIEGVAVRIKGSSATVSGRSTLTNAKYKGMDFSGEYKWTDRFVKQKDGSWRAVSSQARRVKK